MKRLQLVALAGIFLLCIGTFNAVYSNEMAKETPEAAEQLDDDEEYSHESVLPNDLDSDYEEPKTDDVITNDDEESEGENQQAEMIEEGDEV
jgi:hypothetical protein